MLASRVLSRATQLKDSYVAISTYLRTGSVSSLNTCHRGFSCHNSSRSSEQQKASGPAQQGANTGEKIQGSFAQAASSHDSRIEHYKRIFDLPSATATWDRWDLRPDRTSTIHGYVTAKRRGAKRLFFLDLVDPQLRKTLQLVVEKTTDQALREATQQLLPHTPVAVSGQMRVRAVEQESPSIPDHKHPFDIPYHAPPPPHQEEGSGELDIQVPVIEFKKNPYVGEVATTPQIEMAVTSIKALNDFPWATIARTDTNFPPEQRHLQIRTDSTLRNRLRARSKAQTECRKYLFVKGFDEIETPILFKSTPEGAREFLVPTRQQGLAYALPQSPQQFKQILMASGIGKYFQFARCFRDEDSRADRQPEFTQLDIEMSFASAEDVMKITERLVMMLWRNFFGKDFFEKSLRLDEEYRLQNIPSHARLHFKQLTYNDAMTLWGTDKPDTRLGSRICQIQDILDPAVKSKFTPLENPIVDAMRVKVTHNPNHSRQYIGEFFDRPSSAPYVENLHGAPGAFIFDPSKPMNGLSALEHEAAEKMVDLLHPMRGDLVIVQARPGRPFVGESSTMMGDLRRDLHTKLVADGMVRTSQRDEFMWIKDFPLFSPATDSDPGQGGRAGIKSTHHPFTAPKTSSDVESMMTDPLKCTADHFDLVINGVEVGGGSRRIHDSTIQEMVLKEILKVPEGQAEQFRPLLEALRAGCPPHAGVALGFDRLMAILRQATSVRDVIAFPKSANGEDKMVGAPSAVASERWRDYHMLPQEGNKAR